VEAIHYHKDLGVAEITPKSWKDFCVRRGLRERSGLQAQQSELGSGLYLDFEATLTGVETAAKYPSLMRAAQIGGLESFDGPSDHRFAKGRSAVQRSPHSAWRLLAVDQPARLGQMVDTLFE